MWSIKKISCDKQRTENKSIEHMSRVGINTGLSKKGCWWQGWQPARWNVCGLTWFFMKILKKFSN